MDSTARRFDYRSELDRRVQQFTHYLKLMRGRAHGEVQGSCFIIFEERPPDSRSGGNEHDKRRKMVLEVPVRKSVCGGMSTGLDDLVAFDLPDDGWKEDESQRRFIQFAFEPDWFCVDLPRSTLFRREAEKILRCRLGFFYLRDRKDLMRHDQDVGNHDPFRKVYIYGDEETAAEDMAFIYFQVWNFPVDSRFFVTACAFSGEKDWEQGFPIT